MPILIWNVLYFSGIQNRLHPVVMRCIEVEQVLFEVCDIGPEHCLTVSVNVYLYRISILYPKHLFPVLSLVIQGLMTHCVYKEAIRLLN